MREKRGGSYRFSIYIIRYSLFVVCCLLFVVGWVEILWLFVV